MYTPTYALNLIASTRSDIDPIDPFRMELDCVYRNTIKHNM